VLISGTYPRAGRSSLKLRRYSRSVAILAFAAGVLALVAGSIPAAARGHAATSAPRCATNGLVAWLDTQGNGAAGSVYYKLELTNLSGHACTLTGYPGVSAIDLRGRQLGKAAARNPTLVRPRTIRLASGASAAAVLRVTDVGVFPASSCRPVTAAGLRVYPPSQTAARVVPFPFRACSSGPAYLHVAPVGHA
jgi:hypothetical protein